MVGTDTLELLVQTSNFMQWQILNTASWKSKEGIWFSHAVSERSKHLMQPHEDCSRHERFQMWSGINGNNMQKS
jgi:hypothetical protein